MKQIFKVIRVEDLEHNYGSHDEDDSRETVIDAYDTKELALEHCRIAQECVKDDIFGIFMQAKELGLQKALSFDPTFEFHQDSYDYCKKRGKAYPWYRVHTENEIVVKSELSFDNLNGLTTLEPLNRLDGVAFQQLAEGFQAFVEGYIKPNEEQENSNKEIFIDDNMIAVYLISKGIRPYAIAIGDEHERTAVRLLKSKFMRMIGIQV